MSKWKLVPEEPTEEMIEAAYQVFGSEAMGYTYYKLMLAAAPSAPAKDGMSESCLTLAEVYDALLELVDRIEHCGASVELTHAVTLASDMRQAIGNQWNPSDKYAAERVRAAYEGKEEK